MSESISSALPPVHPWQQSFPLQVVTALAEQSTSALYQSIYSVGLLVEPVKLLEKIREGRLGQSLQHSLRQFQYQQAESSKECLHVRTIAFKTLSTNRSPDLPAGTPEENFVIDAVETQKRISAIQSTIGLVRGSLAEKSGICRVISDTTLLYKIREMPLRANSTYELTISEKIIDALRQQISQLSCDLFLTPSQNFQISENKIANHIKCLADFVAASSQ